MKVFSEGACRLPLHHITIRVPWHDSDWNGTVCKNPLENSSCLALRGIGGSRRDDVETRHAGRLLDSFDEYELPACKNERVSFMAPFDIPRRKRHPYANSGTHRHFRETRVVQPAYSAACVPFRWALRENVETGPKNGGIGIAERLQIDWQPEREPDMGSSGGKTWIQQRDNQLALFDTFFGALRPRDSLCFFYAKSTPLSEKSRRVIVGAGRVLGVDDAQEYDYDTKVPPLRAVLWERNVGHSIRPGFADGFLFPYREALKLANENGSDPEEFVAFAPDEHFDSFSYCSELLTNDGAVASLVSCAAALNRIRGRIEGPWDRALDWIDAQLNRLWRARGAFPGLGSALSAFCHEWGFRHGSLLAHEIERLREKRGGCEPWEIVDAAMENPAVLEGPVKRMLESAAGLRNGWKRLSPESRAMLQLLARCAISDAQSLRFYDRQERARAGIEANVADVLANPYLLFECDRRSADKISFGAVDRGMFPEESVRDRFPVAEPSRIEASADPRRVRGLVVDILEEAARQGHALLPQSWVIHRARERALRPSCPLGENVLDVSEERFNPVVSRVSTGAEEPAYQLEHLHKCREIIRREVLGRRRGRPHAAEHHWRGLVDRVLDGGTFGNPVDDLEERARQEKAAALRYLFRSRLSVLIGPAGTGKTTLLRMLCLLPGLQDRGLLLLAPTGKARVRLEERTAMRGKGRTLAQFLIRHQRYNANTGAYFPNSRSPRNDSYRTVIVDECSMLTEEQLAALIDSLINVERLVLVGDPRQLPPIGAGRPFVDIVQELAPQNIEASFPRCDMNFAELTVSRRQRREKRRDASGVSNSGEAGADMLLASHFSGRALDPGADVAFDTSSEGRDGNLRLVQWNQPQELQEKLLAEMVRALNLSGTEDELRFEESLGGIRYRELPWAFFRSASGEHPGAAKKAESWQILSPVHAGLAGADALNRRIQTQFRPKARELAAAKGRNRKVPQPMGSQGLLYGDKVINVVNQRRSDVWPRPDGEAYIANGDIGLIVGQYNHGNFRYAPWKIEVEFAGQPGRKYAFSNREFGDEGRNPLELAYCLTVHKTQGSEFGTTFVVLTNPCWLLSRELLYTALTRHQERLVVLHQGPLAEYRRYAGDEHSDISRRMTNLFIDPLPREIRVGARNCFLEESLIHRTENGDLVRSKSELVIADKLYARGIEYAYEQPLPLPNGRIRYPDFTITDHARGVTFYWEHLGLPDDPAYQRRWKRKRSEYLEAGIRPLDDAGDSERILIETGDQSGGGLDATEIAGTIDRMLRL